MKIEILGPGCATCDALYTEAQRAIRTSGQAVDLEKVEDVASIGQHRFMTTPALVLDGRVKASGRVPDVSEIVSWIRSAAAKQRA